MKLHTKTTCFKPSSAKIIVVLMLMLMIIPGITAMDWDNVQDYDEDTKILTITNALGLGETIARIQLMTPQKMRVGDMGEGIFQRVAEVKLHEFDEDYTNGMGGMELINKVNEEVWEEREYKLKYRTTVREYDKDIYQTVCKNPRELDYKKMNCSSVYQKTIHEEDYEWIEFSELSELPKKNTFIGIYVDVVPGEHGEWIPDRWFGERVEVWAEWEVGLNIGLKHYWTMNDTDTAIIDSVTGDLSRTTAGTPDYSRSALIGTGIRFIENAETEGFIVDPINNSGGAIGAEYTVAFWSNNTDCSHGGIQGTSIGNNFFIRWIPSQPYFQGPAGEFGSADFGCVSGAEYLYITMANASGTFLYINNTILGTGGAGNFADVGSYFAIGGAADASNSLLSGDNWDDGTISEYAIWNRSLTSSEIAVLVQGTTYKAIFSSNAPVTTLSEPANETSTSVNDITFVCNATDDAAVLQLNLTINGVVNQSETGATTTLGLKKTINDMADGNYNWSCTAGDVDNIPVTNGTRLLTINTVPSIDFVSPTPANYTNTTDNYIPVNVSLTETYFDEITFNFYSSMGDEDWIWGDDTRFNNESSFVDGIWEYNVTVTTTTGQSNSTATRTITIDSTPPVINITFPITDRTDGFVTTNEITIGLNWTVSDAVSGLDTCWYFNQTANVTVTCGDNATMDMPYGTYTHIVYANDTLNNMISDSETITYGYALFENSISYTTPVTTGSTQNYVINVTSDGSESVTAVLNYNNITYASSKSGDNTNMVFTNTLDDPSIGANLLYWEITKGAAIYNSSKNTQTVSTFNITDCSSGGSVIWNFTIQDEKLKTSLSGANLTFEIDIDAKTLGGTNIFQYNISVNGTNPIAICTETTLGSNSLIVDALVRHEEKTLGISEFYVIQNHTITNITGLYQNITLYNLKSAEAQEFKITYKDSSFLPVPNAVLEIQRNYIGDGVYRVVERPPFDDEGDTLGNLVLGDVIYTFIVKKDNEILATFNNIKAFCDNAGTGDCKINLNAQNTHVFSDSYQEVDGVDLSISYDESSRTVQVIFSSSDGSTKDMLLNVTTYDLLGNETVCSDTLTSSSGTLSCVIPGTFGNSSAVASTYINGKLRAYKGISLWSDASEIYGYSTVFLSIILFTSIVGIAVSASPVITLVGILVGLMANMGMFLMNGSFFGAGSTFLWGAVLVIVVIWKVSRRSS